jgi:RimJ/RimL family protein N-acetyltransferase
MVEINNECNNFSLTSIINHQINNQNKTKIKEILNNQNLKISPIQIIGKIKRYIFTTNSAIWYERDLTKDLIDYNTKITVKINKDSTSQTIDWLKSQNQSWLVHPKEVETALKNNHYWLSVQNNKEIIGCIKTGFGSVYIVDYNKIITFPKDMAVIYDTFVVEKKRGKGVAKYLISESLRFLKNQGYKRVCCHIPPWNKNSIIAYEKTGFRKVSFIRFIKIFNVPFIKIKLLNEN